MKQLYIIIIFFITISVEKTLNNGIDKASIFCNLYYYILILCVCMSVRPFINSAPGHDTNLKPVSLGPV
jgi:hypothetical protein